MMGTKSFIQLDTVSATYDHVLALEKISLTLERGGLYAVIGPNGAGKSTLLKTLNGVLPLKQGCLTLPKTSLSIAYLPQQSQIDRTFPISVFDVVAMGLWHHIGPFNAYPPQAHEDVLAALADVGMAGHIHRPIAALSGGQFQRVLFARLSLQNANLVLLDEPFNNLDESTVLDLIQIILKWHAQGQTIVAVLHDLDLVKEHFPSSILLACQLVASGPTKEILTVDNINEAYRLMRYHSQGGAHG
jgi:zinc/manganese transport system ATP-binding protein